MVVVILQQGQGSLQRNAGHEHDTAPVVDQTVGNLNGFAFLFCPQLADFELSAPESVVLPLSLELGQGVRPKERTVTAKLSLNAAVSDANVVVEGFDRFLFQLRGGARERRGKLKKEEE